MPDEQPQPEIRPSVEIPEKDIRQSPKPLRIFGWEIERSVNPVETAGAVLTLFALLIVIYQSCEMRKANKIAYDSLKLARDGAEDSRKSDKETAEKAERTTKAIEKSAKAMESQAKSSEDHLAQSKDSSRKSLALSQQALDGTIRNWRLDQRPWLTVSHYEISGEPDEGKPVTVTAFIANSGKTPALQAVSQYKLFMSRGIPEMTAFEESLTPMSRGIIAPGQLTVRMTTKPQVFDSVSTSLYTTRMTTLYFRVMLSPNRE